MEGYQFDVITDHMKLKWLNNIESPLGRIARWVFELQQYDYIISYRKGKLNVVADALSRQPVVEKLRKAMEMVDKECVWISALKKKLACIISVARLYYICSSLKYVWTTLPFELKGPQKFPDYVEEGGLIYRHVPHRAGSDEVASWKLCVPMEMRQQVVKENHDAPTAGHLGVRKTIARRAARYFWPGMQRDIRKYVRSRTNADTGSGGAMGDGMRGFCRPTAQVETRQYNIGDNRSVFEINGDSATSKINNRAAALRNSSESSAYATSSLHQRKWDEHWPELMLAVNSAVSESTGYSPCFVTQGREPRMPRALFVENVLGTGVGQGTPTENATKLKEIFEIVRRNMERAAQDQARHYNLRRRKWSPKVGQTVWAKEHHHQRQPKDSRRNLRLGMTGHIR
ncbi:uncharacterized protein [Drosophila bipectinata]|uniref:uncharacterized protein n=1 Tax=Drosophila bipectinata TaxID=42026 RepID=UPI0038B3173C